MADAPLPVKAVIGQVAEALRARGKAVLIAPPGAGKTTGIAPALLNETWCSGSILLLSPRRVAARAAAERMAAQMQQQAGQTVGYATRMDSRVSAVSRIIVMTEAIFVSRITSDPDLAGISAVLFDEAHERHLDSDLGLALALEAQSVLRPDLRILIMSATIDGARFAELLGDAAVVQSEGRSHPLAIVHDGGGADQRVEHRVARAVRRAWADTADDPSRDILVFLPGVRDIDRVHEILAPQLPEAALLLLHGQVAPAEQRRALVRDKQGRRRIVLATAIAETSLTLDGVSIVVDAGLSRRARFDAETGLTRLVTTRASQASAAQRAGRAARQRAGTCYRLWEQAASSGMPSFDPPEILGADLAPMTLTLAKWGTRAEDLRWLDPPSPAALVVARAGLRALGAIDENDALTPHGTQLESMGLAPPLAAMVLYGARHGASQTAARLALLVQERRLGGTSDDLSVRLAQWNRSTDAHADAARALAAGWARLAQQIANVPDRSPSDKPLPHEVPSCGVLLAQAFPKQVARRRDASGEYWLTAGGRGLRLDPASALARSEWLSVTAAQGEASGARIMAATPLEPKAVEQWLTQRIDRRSVLRWHEGRVEARVQRRLGAITLAEGPDPNPDQEAIAAMLVAKLRSAGLDALPLGTASQALLMRAHFAGLEELAPTTLLAEAECWLLPLVGGSRSLGDLDVSAIHHALYARLDWTARQTLERVAPPLFVSPAGSSHPIDYAAPGGPQVTLRVQALFGLDLHPLSGSPPRPLLLQLTSPAGRPIQATADLPGFWRGSWVDVRRDMKGRYPRHRWPERPWEEAPSLKTRNAFEKGRTGGQQA
ncbi:ATP-dependent helicase HrpB [Croceicoccus sp. F390]|uniref:ATP-dependent helicase HrpB n=1 Tax=Croceicoccus esteveae TaxID=3075597 RepID=A0ABU2ZLU6_9SPHN|nr:ATP-dependent helicase HrpB [Croceicoccus sp. F390]MDT0576554.1 ATP-dependent helicase HrpB [Croceicoccus sp. F390]